jgi:hypothetical protein
MHDRHGIEAMACQSRRVSLGQGRVCRVVTLGKLQHRALALGAGAMHAQEIERRTDSNAPGKGYVLQPHSVVLLEARASACGRGREIRLQTPGRLA